MTRRPAPLALTRAVLLLGAWAVVALVAGRLLTPGTFGAGTGAVQDVSAWAGTLTAVAALAAVFASLWWRAWGHAGVAALVLMAAGVIAMDSAFTTITV